MENNKYFKKVSDIDEFDKKSKDKMLENMCAENYVDLVNKLNEMMDKNIKQESFLLNISHDLRAHLSVILSIMQCIDNGSVEVKDTKALEYMNIVKRNSLKMLKLINNLIDTTKFQNNFYVLNKENIDIIAMVEGTVNCIDKYAKQKNIQLIFDTNEEECIMAIDTEVIDRVIMNLISNAIKFSNQNTNIYINILVEEDIVRISVKDEGPGISKEDQGKIFNRFYQISEKNDRENCGSGIGLDLVNYLTKAHGGDIEIISEEGKGSEFVVILPIITFSESEQTIRRKQNDKVQMLEIEFSDIYLI